MSNLTTGTFSVSPTKKVKFFTTNVESFNNESIVFADKPTYNGGLFTYDEALAIRDFCRKYEDEVHLLTAEEWDYMLTKREGERYAVASRNGKLCLYIYDDNGNNYIVLPAAGGRNVTPVINVGTYGYYWSSTHGGDYRAFSLRFRATSVGTQGNGNRYSGRSVRLAKYVS